MRLTINSIVRTASEPCQTRRCGEIVTCSVRCQAITLSLLLGAASHDARAEKTPARDGHRVVFSSGLRARFEDGKLRPAKLVFTERAVTVEQDSHPPQPFAYKDLHIRRGRHYRGGPIFDKRLILDTLLYNAPLIAISGLNVSTAVHSVAIPIAISPAVELIFRILDRDKGHWLELHTHKPRRNVYLRLPGKKSRREAIYKELARRDTRKLIVRPPGTVPKPRWTYPVTEGDMAPDFELEDMDGSTWRLSELRGKVVLLNFWATWCGPCRQEMPHLEKLHRMFSEDGLVLLGVNEESLTQVREYLNEEGIIFPNLHTPDGQVFRLYGVNALPTSLIVDRHGRVHKRIRGFPGERALTRALKEPLFHARHAAK